MKRAAAVQYVTDEKGRKKSVCSASAENGNQARAASLASEQLIALDSFG